MTGFLVDSEIQSLLNSGQLIAKGTWQETQIRHASYTLRLGDEVRVVDAVGSSDSIAKDERIVRFNSQDELELRPGQRALLYSEEELNLPKDMLGFTIARGLLFAESLAPENTYVDPGFSGRLYTTVVNISDRIVTLKLGMNIARLFFYRLHKEASQPYTTGRALKIEQDLESARAVPLTMLRSS